MKGYVKEPSDMFQKPIHVKQCPLCGGDVYVESNPSDDPSMTEACCKCTWNQNQFMSWSEMNNL